MASLFKIIFGDNRPINQSSVAIAEREPIYDKIAPKPKYTVQDIHNDFKSAADQIIIDAENIISLTPSPEVEKAKRLSKLGFTSSKEVRDTSLAATKEKEKTESDIRLKLQAEAAKYFSQKYPFNKFITRDRINRLCNKYGLQFGSVDRYIGEVPEINMAAIESFNIKEEDIPVVIEYCDPNKGHDYYHSRCYYTINQEELKKIGLTQKDGSAYLKKSRTGYKEWVYKYSDSIMTIIAPPSDFLQRRQQVVDGNIVEVKDPIVLHSVYYEGLNDIYLIVTAWGEEASDPDVVNVKMN